MGKLIIGGVLITWALILAVSDFRTRTLPNILTLPALLVAATWAIVSTNWWAITSGLCWFLLYVVVAYLSAGIGGGDIKLAPTLGLLIGTDGVVPVLIAIGLAQIFSIVTGLLLKQKRIPHGPGMLLATVLVWLAVPAARLF